jgi:hypothetical protein
MKLKDELTEEETRRMAIAGSVMVIALFAICLPSFYYLFIAESAISISNAMESGVSIFVALRTTLLIIYILWFLPASILAEAADSWVKKRSFRPWNVLVFMLLFGEALIITASLYTLFDTSLPGTSFLIQFPLIVVGFSIGLLLTVATIEKTRIKGYIKSAFD